ncbi:TolC family protein [Massilia sp. TWP1-3-3]|uniref:TolC family protein n=1 Tax=Massilia sp. TWP1-3-3 TaxID=2804573 RepID=UPI003CE734BA
MHVNQLRALLCCAILVFPLGVSAAPEASATLHALVEQAWLRSPSLRGAIARQEEVDAARALSGSWVAGQPILELSQRTGRSGGQDGARESEVTMSASFWTPAQRSARQGLAQHSAAELQSELVKVRLDIAGEVRARLWDAAAAQALREEKEGQLHNIEKLADEVKRRVAAGDLARLDALLAEQEVQGARVAVEQAGADTSASLAKLRILTGPAGALPLEPEPLASASATGDPRVLAARATQSLAQATLRLAQASRRAPPTLALSLREERDPLLAAPDRSVGLRLQLPLGSAGRNRPVEAQAQTQLAVAGAAALQSEQLALAELDLARTRIEHARTALAAAGARVSATREHEQLIEKAFRLGERGLADMLRSHALAHEARLARRQQEIALGRAHAEFNQASGVLP